MIAEVAAVTSGGSGVGMPGLTSGAMRAAPEKGTGSRTSTTVAGGSPSCSHATRMRTAFMASAVATASCDGLARPATARAHGA